MKKLLTHFENMQQKMREYLVSEPYVDLEGIVVTHNDNRDRAFIHDMIYMLDGPQQREAQPEAEFDYQALALRTEADSVAVLRDVMLTRLTHAQFGIATELGEFADPLKKCIFYGRNLDAINPKTGMTGKQNMREELGDILWYLAIACDALNTTIEAEMRRNIDKLQARYPEKFTSDKAENRDLTQELKSMGYHDGGVYDVKYDDCDND